MFNSRLGNKDFTCCRDTDSMRHKQDPMQPNRWIVIIQSLSSVQLFVTPWTAAHQASLSFTISWSLLKLMSIELVMSFNHIILCHPPSLPAFNLSQHQGLFQWVSSSHQVAKVLELQLQHQSFQYSGLISFSIDWFDLLAVQWTFKSLL